MTAKQAIDAAEALCDKWVNVKQARALGSKTQPKLVYYYTNAAGLVGIVQSGIIRATDYRFLNDRTEMTHGQGRAEKILGMQKFRALPKDLIDSVKDLQFTRSDTRIFVVSFSSRPDDLSQWRGYANDVKGLPLAFLPKRSAT